VSWFNEESFMILIVFEVSNDEIGLEAELEMT
jgi:hypothetical protein